VPPKAGRGTECARTELSGAAGAPPASGIRDPDERRRELLVIDHRYRPSDSGRKAPRARPVGRRRSSTAGALSREDVRRVRLGSLGQLPQFRLHTGSRIISLAHTCPPNRSASGMVLLSYCFVG
jgi:hypothetical protein